MYSGVLLVEDGGVEYAREMLEPEKDLRREESERSLLTLLLSRRCVLAEAGVKGVRRKEGVLSVRGRIEDGAVLSVLDFGGVYTLDIHSEEADQ